jgi:hypothetical protein
VHESAAFVWRYAVEETHMNLPKLYSRRAWHASLIALVTALLLENGQIASAAGDDPIAAMVNGEPITRTELLLALASPVS